MPGRRLLRRLRRRGPIDTDEPIGPRRAVRGRARRARRAGRRAAPSWSCVEDAALGRPVDPRAAQLPVRPPVPRRRSPSSRPTAATTCTAATRCGTTVAEWAGCPASTRLQLEPAQRRATSAPGARAAPGPAARGDVHAHRRARRGQRVLHRGARGRGRAGPAGLLPDDLADLLLAPPRPARRHRPADRPRGVRGGPPGLPRAARPRRRPRPAPSSTGPSAPPSTATCWCRSAPTATRSGTPCSPRRSTTTCCLASGCACTRAYAAALRAGGVRRHRRRDRPARARRPRPRPPRCGRASQAGDEAMSVGGPDEAARALRGRARAAGRPELATNRS